MTTNEARTVSDLSGNVESVIVDSSTITINIESIEKVIDLLKNISNVYSELNLNELIGVTVGHEIEHTTNEDATLKQQGKSTKEIEKVPSEKGDKIIDEIISNKEKQEKENDDN